MAWIHHLSLHFPIALSFVLAAFGIYTLKRDEDSLWTALVWGSRFAFLTTSVAAISGLLAARELWTEDGPHVLIHHRNLGLLVWACAGAAFAGLEWGRHEGEKKAMKFGALAWIAVSVAVLGAGHWGGWGIHHDVLPWDVEDPGVRIERRG